MKHRFLLDENVLYHAIKGVDEHDKPDSTATELLLLIGKNCHSIFLNRFLLNRYWRHLKLLEKARPVALEPIVFVKNFMHNSEKQLYSDEDLPPIPDGVVVPAEDEHVVRAALISHSLVVTADDGLRRAVIAHSELLTLTALTPREAIRFASDT